MRSWWFLS